MLIDDHTVLRDGLKSIFEIEDDVTIVGEADSGEAALKQVPVLQPDVILLDINLPDQNGIVITSKLKKLYKDIKILILTMHSHEEYFMAAIREGADGYLLKDAPSEQVVEAVRKVMQGEAVIHPSMTKKLMAFHQQQSVKVRDTELTEREREVLACLVQGLSNKEIADHLFISDKTVKIHVSKIFKKINVKSRSQAVIHAIQHQLVPTS